MVHIFTLILELLVGEQALLVAEGNPQLLKIAQHSAVVRVVRGLYGPPATLASAFPRCLRSYYPLMTSRSNIRVEAKHTLTERRLCKIAHFS